MIARSRSIAALCLAGALGLHAAGVLNADLDQPAMEEGGPGATVAALGNSFADMTAGVEHAEPTEDFSDAPEPQQADTARPDAPAPVPETVETAAQPRPEHTPAPLPEPQTPPQEATAAPPPTAQLTTTPTVALTALPELAPLLPPTAVLVPHPARPMITEPPPPPEVISAMPDEVSDDAMSKRPRLRSPEFEAQHAPKTEPTPAKPPRQAIKTPKKRGNNAKRTANRGSSSGQLGAKATKQGGGNKRSKKAGNAAVTNYPGKVRRCVNRGARTRGLGRGTAVVSFRVAGSGQLTNIGLARSSGNAKLDRAAAQAIRRVGRCPAPPPGARRSFSIKIIGK